MCCCRVSTCRFVRVPSISQTYFGSAFHAFKLAGPWLLAYIAVNLAWTPGVVGWWIWMVSVPELAGGLKPLGPKC